jgi:mercuric reductase
MKLDIKGMTCIVCAKHITESLEKIKGINSIEVSYENANAEIDTTLDSATVIKLVENAGYKAQESHCTNGVCSSQLHVAIIGSGSGAFAAGIKAAEEGARVTIIEAAQVIGGCCVNVGCVPSKIMIRSAHLAQHQRKNPFPGIKNHEPEITRSLLAQQQQNRVDELRMAKYESILEKNPALTLIKGFASFKDTHTLIIKKEDDTEEQLSADRILIATGSKPFIPPIKGIDNVPYWTSTEALFADELPKKMTVIGSSVIALEIAQAYQRLGTQVTLLARHTLLYSEEPELGKNLQSVLESEGMTVLTHTQAQEVSFQNDTFNITLNKGEIQTDKLLIAAGRNANTENLNLKAIGLETDRIGAVIVNERLETNIKDIYAVGDCSDMPQFVYVAAAAGTRAAINMTGGYAKLDLSTMPAVIFTDPQVATVGLTEEQVIAKGINTITRQLDLENVPRSLANFETEGFIKMVANKDSMQILGVQILAADAGEMIQTAVLAIHNNMTTIDLAGQLFPYLTMVEGLKLCAQTFVKDVSELSCCAG